MADREVTVKVRVKPAETTPLKRVFSDLREDGARTGEGIGRSLSKGLAGRRQDYGMSRLAGGEGGGLSGGIGGSLAAASGGMGSGLGLALAAASGVVGVVVKIASIIKNLSMSTVTKASPVTMDRLSMAWDDMMAVIGQSLLPVVELLTDAFRLLGDLFATILPSADEMRSAFAGMTDVFQEIRSALVDAAPALKVIFSAILQFTGMLASIMARLFTWEGVAVLKLLGSGKNAPLKSSVGAAARPVSVSTDIVGFLRQQYAQTLAGRGKSVAERQADAAEKANDLLQELVNQGNGDSGKGPLSEKVDDAAKLGLGRFN